MAAQVSIVLPTYNRAHLLTRALDSVQMQTFEDWELVIVDDGSTDATEHVVARYADSDPRIRRYFQPNSGLSMARNAGIDRSGGDFITFLDSDDEYLPTHLEIRVAYMRRHPEVDMLHGGLVVVGGPDMVPDIHDPSRSIPIAECFVGGTFFMRAHVPRRVGGFRKPDFGDDYEFMQRVLPLFRVERCHEATYVYHRDAPDSMCNQAARPGG